MNRLLREYCRIIIAETFRLRKDVTLYHRSQHLFKVGDEISASNNERKNITPGKEYEICLEDYRKEHHPNLPSRLECVYATLTPSSRFNAYGHLYMVKPMGKMFVTNSYLIDEMMETEIRNYSEIFEYLGGVDWLTSTPKEERAREFANRLQHQIYYDVKEYWQGTDPSKDNIKGLEVLLDGAIVTEVVEEKKRLKPGTVFELKQTFNNVITLTSHKLSTMKEEIPGLKRDDEHYSVDLMPGFKGKILSAFGDQIIVSPINHDDIRLSISYENAHKFYREFRKGNITKI